MIHQLGVLETTLLLSSSWSRRAVRVIKEKVVMDREPWEVLHSLCLLRTAGNGAERAL